ncbi:MAG: transposase, partial [Acidimicrobiia bacterium]
MSGPAPVLLGHLLMLVGACRDGGAVGNRPIYTAVGVTVDGERKTSWGCGPALAAKERSSGFTFLTEIKNRGVADACIVVWDGLS